MIFGHAEFQASVYPAQFKAEVSLVRLTVINKVLRIVFRFKSVGNLQKKILEFVAKHMTNLVSRKLCYQRNISYQHKIKNEHIKMKCAL